MGTSRLTRGAWMAGMGTVGLLLVVPTSALAITDVTIVGNTLVAQGDFRPSTVTVARSGGSFTVSDPAAQVVGRGIGCTPVTPSASVTCTAPTADVPIEAIDLLGGDGDDTLIVSPTGDIGAAVSMNGEAGNDTLRGGSGDDEFVDSVGNDTYTGGPGTDVFLDAAGNDIYSGGTDEGRFQSHDVVDFSRRTQAVSVSMDGAANDGPASEAANNVGMDVEAVVGTIANDTFTGGAGDDDFDGGPGDDVLAGGPGHDTLAGGAGTDRLAGGPGDDDLDDSEGSDDMSGGEGDDTVTIVQALAVTVSLDDVANDGAGGESKNVHSDVENITTGPGSDKITGSAAINRIDGGSGDDQIDGLGGVDTLKGGPGDDRIVSTDGAPDAVLCADGGADAATVDAVDAVVECERVTGGRPGAGGDGGSDGSVSDRVKPRVSIGGVAAALARRAFSKGLKLSVRTSEPAKLVVELLAPLGAGRKVVTVGRSKLGLGNGTRALTLKPTARFAKRAPRKRTKLTIRVTATDAAGNVAVATRRLSIK